MVGNGHIIARCRLSDAIFLAITLSAIMLCASSTASDSLRQYERVNRTLVISIDGLHPEYITPEITPNLYAMGENGVVGEVHSAIYPSYTRVNSASLGTGTFPGEHGLIHNYMYHPAMGEVFSTTDMANLYRLDDVTDGRMITVPSLGEELEREGRLLLAAGTGGTGNTLLQNPRGAGKGIWQVGGFFIPESAREEAVDALGEPPRTRGPEGTAWAIDAYLYHASSDQPPDVTFLWIGETDMAGHEHGVGAPRTLEAVSHVDRQIGRIIDAHEETGLDEKVNIFVTADHGFSTATREFDIEATLERAGLLEDVIIARNQIYVERPDDLNYTSKIVEALQRDSAVGNIYTRPAARGPAEGIIPGTLSTSVIQWDHPRSADILVSPMWSSAVNEFGYEGTTTFSARVATHGSDSPYDLRIRLIADGPDIKKGVRSMVPTSNVDFAPTIMHLQGLEPVESMSGRVMRELLGDGPEPADILIHEHSHTASVTYPDGFRYQAEMDVLRVDATPYLRGARTTRTHSASRDR